jgi:molecular chaperone GrpE
MDSEEQKKNQNKDGSSGEEELTDQTLEPVAMDACREELAAAQAKATEYLDGWQRAMADFANYKRRIEREQSQIYQTTSGNILKRFLEVADDLERALKNRPTSGEGAAWAGGIELIYRKLLSYIESEGVKVMQAEGQMFDPNLHEAVSQEESPDHESGQIIEVLKNGYMIGDRVLRPASVRVAR